MRLRLPSLIAIAVTAICASSSVLAIDSGSLEFATGNKTKMLRLGLQSNWDNQWFASNGTHLGGYWDFTLAQWRGANFQSNGGTQNLTDLGATPVFRFQNDSKKGLYGEAAIGFHMLSEIYDNNSRHFSTNFQFGDHIGVGYVTKDGWDLSFKIQHYSNGGIKHPNPGVNFAVLKAGYAF